MRETDVALVGVWRMNVPRVPVDPVQTEGQSATTKMTTSVVATRMLVRSNVRLTRPTLGSSTDGSDCILSMKGYCIYAAKSYSNAPQDQHHRRER